MALNRISIARADLVAVLSRVVDSVGRRETPAALLEHPDGSREVLAGAPVRDHPEGPVVVIGRAPDVGDCGLLAREVAEGAGRPAVGVAVGGDGRGALVAAWDCIPGRRPGPLAVRVVGTGIGCPAWPPPTLRYSRVAGALGATTWSRLAHLRVAVVGCSRTGTPLCEALARSGVGELVLVDPDHLEAHNLDTLGSPRDLGRPKAEVLAERLRRFAPRTRLSATVSSVSSYAGTMAIRGADLVVTCVDNDAARWVAAARAVAYLRPHLDVGTAVIVEGGEMGLDVRLWVPGDGCLICAGGIRDPAAVAAQRAGSPGGPELWWRQRTGSLPGLNQIAVGHAVTLLTRLLGGGRVHSPRWLRVTMTEPGNAVLDGGRLDGSFTCGLCARRGWGDTLEADLATLPPLGSLAAQIPTQEMGHAHSHA